VDSLIYQLLDYERTLRPGSASPAASDKSSELAELEEEWGRRRQMLDVASSDTDDDWRENAEVAREARALDKAMEDRMLARKASASSVSSGGLGMGLAWKTRYGGRRRTGSIASNLTNGSLLSEDLVEEDEEAELLGVGGGFDDKSPMSRASSAEPDDLPHYQDTSVPYTPMTARPPRMAKPPPSAPAHKSSFSLPPPPATAIRATFNLPPRSKLAGKPRRRPAPLAILPPVPSSPDAPPSAKIPQSAKAQQSTKLAVPSRLRTESRRPTPPPLFLRSISNDFLPVNENSPQQHMHANTPSQTLFVFPPSPTPTTRTPSTMTLMSTSIPVPFPLVSPPKVSTTKTHGRTRSFIGLGVPPTPTTACSRVDARGYFGAN
jgi:tyrosine-protein phosphatase MSG5